VGIDNELVFAVENPLFRLDLFDKWKIPRILVFCVVPDEDEIVDFF
jgi:hypothetical protein